MIPGNNFSEIKELREVQNQIMDAIALADDIMRRHASLDEMKTVCRSINDKQAAIKERLQAYRRAIYTCDQKLEILEEKEDALQLECFSLLSRDLEDADAAKAHLVAGNRRLSSWISRNLSGLKAMFSRERMSA